MHPISPTEVSLSAVNTALGAFPNKTKAAQQRSVFFLTITATAASAVFLLYGCLILPMLGFEADEVTFVVDLWRPARAVGSIIVFGHQFPSMYLNYAGALKSYIFAPILTFWGANVWSIRTPALVLAFFTILLAARLSYQCAGRVAALVTIALLATDESFLLTSVFDWGPVVLQNLLWVLLLLSILSWYRTHKDWLLFLAGIALGLVLWDKALFMWNLSGMAVAAAVLCWREISAAWSIRRTGLLVLGFCLGAAPLIQFNLQQHGSTFRSNSHFSTREVGEKAQYLWWSIDGRVAAATFRSDYVGKIEEAVPLEKFALSLAKKAESQSNWRAVAGLAIIILGFLAGSKTHKKWLLFLLISGSIGWLESALTVGAGGSIHHVVLFWLNWYLACAIAAAAIYEYGSSWALKIFVLTATAVLTVRGAVTENALYANLILYSPHARWTTADVALAQTLLKYGVHRAVAADWGIEEPLMIRSQSSIDISVTGFDLNRGSFDKSTYTNCAWPACVIVTHTPERSLFSNASFTLQQGIDQQGLRESHGLTIKDTHGFPMFLVSNYVSMGKAGGGANPETSATNKLSIGQVVATAYPLRADFKFWAVPPSTGDRNGLIQIVNWSTPGVNKVEIRITSPSGTLFAAGGPDGSAPTGPWARPGEAFYLEDATTGNPTTPQHLLATLTLR
jgi:hypothetical protein